MNIPILVTIREFSKNPSIEYTNADVFSYFEAEGIQKLRKSLYKSKFEKMYGKYGKELEIYGPVHDEEKFQKFLDSKATKVGCENSFFKYNLIYYTESCSPRNETDESLTWDSK
eukprot:gene12420-6178_t